MHRLVETCLLFLAVVPRGFANDEALAARFPDAGAVVLSWDTVWTIGRVGGKNSVHISKRIFVRDPRGYSAANQWFVYNGSPETVTKFTAETTQSDGTKIKLGPDLVRDSVAGTYGDTQTRFRQFTFPNVRSGSTLSYDFEMSFGFLPVFIPISSGWWEIQSSFPVVRSTMTVRSQPGARVWNSSTLGLRPLTEYCRTTPNDTVEFRSFETVCDNVPAFVNEDLAPPEQDVRLRAMVWAVPIGYHLEFTLGRRLNDWPTCHDEELLTEEVRQIAARWPVDTMPADKRVEAIVRWVRESIAFDDTIASEPVDAALKRKRASGTERNLIALALLKASRIRAQGAILTNRTLRRFDPNFPPTAKEARFVIMVGNAEHPTYLDVNCKFCVPGIAEWDLAGAGSGGLPRPTAPGSVIHEVRPVPAEANAERRARLVQVRSDGTATVEGKITWQLQQDVYKRELWSRVSGSARQLDCIEELDLDPIDARVSTTDPDDLTQNLQCEFSARGDQYVISAAGKLLIRPADDFSNILQLPLQETRMSPIRWRFPRSVQADTTYRLPAGFVVNSWPPPVTLRSGKLSFQARWGPGPHEGEVSYKAVLVVGIDELPNELYDDARRFRAEMLRHLSTGITADGVP